MLNASISKGGYEQHLAKSAETMEISVIRYLPIEQYHHGNYTISVQL